MYKKIIMTAAAVFAAAAIGAASAFAADGVTVRLDTQSYSVTANLDKEGLIYDTQSRFTAPRDMKMIVMSDGNDVGIQVKDASGSVKAEKNGGTEAVTLDVKKGETYALSLIAPSDGTDASVYVYGI